MDSKAAPAGGGAAPRIGGAVDGPPSAAGTPRSAAAGSTSGKPKTIVTVRVGAAPSSMTVGYSSNDKIDTASGEAGVASAGADAKAGDAGKHGAAAAAGKHGHRGHHHGHHGHHAHHGHGRAGHLGAKGGIGGTARSIPARGEHTRRKRLGARMFSHNEDRDEFRLLDYTPLVNRRPVDLSEELRVTRAERFIKLFICVTMYNEESDELKHTLTGIAENLPALEAMGVHWREVCVCLVVDGISKASTSTLEYLHMGLKLFDPALVQDRFHHNPVTVHLFEKSVQMRKHTSDSDFHKPLQLVLALKQKNGGKLNSHLWFFTGFCNQVNPEWILLVDVGTIPRPTSIAQLCEAMRRNSEIGGVCGEIAVRHPKVYNPIVAAQHFEYKVSHVLDKAMESVFGYISVLPGAFSAYKWEAIRGEPLSAYFMVEENNLKELGPFLANMYLAEDRVLCFEVLAKRNRRWTLYYVAGAVAETDVPDNLVELIKQRRRWLNGSFFALVYYVSKFHRFAAGSHSLLRKAMLHVQFVYQFMTMVLNWFMIGTLYLSFTVIYFSTFGILENLGPQLVYGFNLAYMFLMMLQVISGLGGKATNVHTIYYVSSVVFGALMVIAMGLGIGHAFTTALESDNQRWWLILAVGSAFISYIVATLLHGQFITTFLAFPQYLFMLPTFINTFTTFSFCNMHDISWGTKEGNLTSERRRPRQKERERQAIDSVAEKEQQASIVKQVLNLSGAAGGDAAAAGDGGVANAEAVAKLMAGSVRGGGGAGAAAGAGFAGLSLAGAAAAAAQRQNAAAEEEELRLIDIEIKKDREAAEAEFAAFRTRLLGLWLVSNWAYVTFVASFGWIDTFAATIAVLIMFSITYKIIGTVWYKAEELTMRVVYSPRCSCLLSRACKCFWCPRCLHCCVCCRPNPPPLTRDRVVTQRERSNSMTNRIIKTASYFVTANGKNAGHVSGATSRHRRRVGAGPKGMYGADGGSGDELEYSDSDGSDSYDGSGRRRGRGGRRGRRRRDSVDSRDGYTDDSYTGSDRSYSGSRSRSRSDSRSDSRSRSRSDSRSRSRSTDEEEEELDGVGPLERGGHSRSRSRQPSRHSRHTSRHHSRRSSAARSHRSSHRSGRGSGDRPASKRERGDSQYEDGDEVTKLPDTTPEMARKRWGRIRMLGKIVNIHKRRQGPMVDLEAVLQEGEATSAAIMSRKDDKVEYNDSITKEVLEKQMEEGTDLPEPTEEEMMWFFGMLPDENLQPAAAADGGAGEGAGAGAGAAAGAAAGEGGASGKAPTMGGSGRPTSAPDTSRKSLVLAGGDDALARTTSKDNVHKHEGGATSVPTTPGRTQYKGGAFSAMLGAVDASKPAGGVKEGATAAASDDAAAAAAAPAGVVPPPAAGADSPAPPLPKAESSADLKAEAAAEVGGPDAV